MKGSEVRDEVETRVMSTQAGATSGGVPYPNLTTGFCEVAPSQRDEVVRARSSPWVGCERGRNAGSGPRGSLAGEVGGLVKQARQR